MKGCERSTLPLQTKAPSTDVTITSAAELSAVTTMDDEETLILNFSLRAASGMPVTDGSPMPYPTALTNCPRRVSFAVLRVMR